MVEKVKKKKKMKCKETNVKIKTVKGPTEISV